MTLILQNDESDCLLACYAMILDSMGARVMLADLQEFRNDPRLGTSVRELRRANKQYGVEMSAVKTEGKPDFRRIRSELSVPVIAHLLRGHFVVITSIGRRSIRLNDPAFGPAEMTFEEFATVSSGIFITFKKTESFRRVNTRPSSLAALRSIGRGTKGLLIAAVLISQCVAISVGFITKLILDGEIDKPVQMVLIAILLATLVFVSAEVQRKAAQKGVDDFEERFSKDVFRGLSQKSLMWIKNRGGGRIVEQISLRNQIRDILLKDLGPSVVSVLSLIPVFIYMLVLSPSISLVLLLTFLMYLFALAKLSLQRFYKYQGYVFGQIQLSGQISDDMHRWKEVAVRRENDLVAGN